MTASHKRPGRPRSYGFIGEHHPGDDDLWCANCGGAFHHGEHFVVYGMPFHDDGCPNLWTPEVLAGGGEGGARPEQLPLPLLTAVPDEKGRS